MVVPLAVLGFRSADRFRLEIAALKKRNETELANLVELIKHLADSDAVFLETNEASRSLLFSFDLDNGQDASAAAAARILDPRVANASERLGQDKSDQELLFNFFSHVTALLSRVFFQEDDGPLLELIAALRALIRVEGCESLMALLSWQAFRWSDDEPQRSEVEATIEDDVVREALALLEPILVRFQYSRSDVMTLASCIAIEEMGGPKIAWRPGRCDEDENECYVDASVYFGLQEKIVLTWIESCRAAWEKRRSQGTSTGHSSGTNGGIVGVPLVSSPVRKGHQRPRHTFDNSYFEDLLLLKNAGFNSDKRSVKVENGASTTAVLSSDDELRWVELYANDETRFIQDFCFAFTKLQEYRFRFDHPTTRSPRLRRGRSSGTESAFSQGSEYHDNSAIAAEEALGFKLPPKLAVFDFASADATLPASPQWRKAVFAQTDQIYERLLGLTKDGFRGKITLDVFRKPHPDTHSSFSFDLANKKDMRAALEAGNADKNLTKFKPSLVPKTVTESEFYTNYFSHVYQIRRLFSEKKKSRLIKVFVGSKNPVKVNACRRAFVAAFRGQNKRFEFIGMDTPSGVSDQPMGDQETRQGAINRATHCRKLAAPEAPSQVNAEFYVGIEGGLVDEPPAPLAKAPPGAAPSPEMTCCAWIAVMANQDGAINAARTATFTIPAALASLVRKGIELGRADDVLRGTTNSKQKGGTVGSLTGGEIDRTAYYKHAMILCLAPFAHPKLHF